MSRLSRELTAQGFDIISLSLGEPDFDTPENIKQAAKKAIDDNITHYPPISGFLELRKAIARKFETENGLHFSPEQIVVSTGAKQSIANVVLSLIDAGDEVLLPAPYWVSYLELIKLAEGKPVVIKADLEQNFKITPAQLAASITPKSKLMIFSSPSNPTGSVYSEKELRDLADVLQAHPQVMVLSDEIYEHINFEGKTFSIGAIDSLKERVITVNGLSKAYAMTGWRLGYIGAPLWVAKACDKMQGQITSGTSSISQMAAIEAMQTPHEVVEAMKDEFLKRRDVCYELLRNIPGLQVNKPSGAFYFLPKVDHYFGKTFKGEPINNAVDLSMYLLHHGHVAVVSGESFGSPECIRLSYATSETKLREAIRRMDAALKELK